MKFFYFFIFFHVIVAKTAYFYFGPCFYKDFVHGEIYKKSIVYCQDQEIACCCLDCREKKKFLSISYSEESNDYFDNF